MATVLEFRQGRRTEHHEDSEHLADAWAFAESMNQIAWEWARLPLNMMEGYSVWMRDQKSRDERNVLPLDEYRRETRRFSSMASRPERRKRDDDEPGGAA